MERAGSMERVGLWPKSVQTVVVLVAATVIAAVGAALTAPDAVAVASEGLLTRAELLLPY
jgi:hypothetical protein